MIDLCSIRNIARDLLLNMDVQVIDGSMRDL